MTVTVPVKTGTFDGVAPNPCGHTTASKNECLGNILTPGIDYCPTSPYQVFTDAPNVLYTDGNVPPNPPYTQFDGTTSRPFLIQTSTGTKVFRCNINASASLVSSWSLHQYQGGFSPTTPCGIYCELECFTALSGSGSHDAAGICLGMGTTPNVDFNWYYLYIGKLNGSNTFSFSRKTGISGATTISSSSSFNPSVGQKLRLLLTGDGQTCKAQRVDVDGTTVLFEVTTSVAVSSGLVAPGKNVGIFRTGTGGSGSGTTANLEFINFKFGIY